MEMSSCHVQPIKVDSTVFSGPSLNSLNTRTRNKRKINKMTNNFKPNKDNFILNSEFTKDQIKENANAKLINIFQNYSKDMDTKESKKQNNSNPISKIASN